MGAGSSAMPRGTSNEPPGRGRPEAKALTILALSLTSSYILSRCWGYLIGVGLIVPCKSISPERVTSGP